ncbi:MAG: hypothetical protein U5K37_08675 [Natrialbaceae archaeon]|nr:hypothetical protein [Natrialbaceae archaeon]
MTSDPVTEDDVTTDDGRGYRTMLINKTGKRYYTEPWFHRLLSRWFSE